MGQLGRMAKEDWEFKRLPIPCGSTLTRRIIWMAGCVSLSHLAHSQSAEKATDGSTQPTGNSKSTSWPSSIIGLVH